MINALYSKTVEVSVVTKIMILNSSLMENEFQILEIMKLWKMIEF